VIKKEICHLIKLVSAFALWQQGAFDDKSVFINMYSLVYNGSLKAIETE